MQPIGCFGFIYHVHKTLEFRMILNSPRAYLQSCKSSYYIPKKSEGFGILKENEIYLPFNVYFIVGSRNYNTRRV